MSPSSYLQTNNFISERNQTNFGQKHPPKTAITTDHFYSAPEQEFKILLAYFRQLHIWTLRWK